MNNLGEIISLAVAISWTATALFADLASHRLGTLPLNLIRLFLSLCFLTAALWITTGYPYPAFADGKTIFWLALSGLVGYVFGDYCLFNSYIIFGSKFGQLFMTLAPPFAGIAGWLILGETMSWRSWFAMLVTLTGIGISIMAKNDDSGKLTIKLPLKGILFGIGAGLGQGVGLVLSKMGLTHYSAALPAQAPETMAMMLPFAGTFIRAVAGFTAFGLIILRKKKRRTALVDALHDGKGLSYAVGTSFFGPFLGVSMSLMAVQYAKAGIASTLMALTPVLIIVPYSLIYKQKIQLREVIGTIITIIGVALFFLL